MKKYLSIKSMKDLSKNKFLMESAIIFLGTIFVRAISFIVSIILARYLEIGEFGNFNLVQSNMTMLITLIDVGLSTGFIKYAAMYSNTDKEKLSALLNITLKIKIILCSFIVVIGFVFSKEICLFLFKDVSLDIIFKISLIGIFMETIYSYTNYILRANEKFFHFSISGIIYAIVQVTLIINFSIIFGMNSVIAMLSVVLTPILACIYNLFILPKDLFKGSCSKEKSIAVFKELFSFTKWIAISTVCNLLISRVDILMLKYYMNSNELGLYSAAQKLSMIFPILVTTLTTILLPKVSKYKSKDEYKSLIKTSCKFGILMIPVLILLLLISRPLVLILLGNKFLMVVPIFNTLIISYMFAIFANPISLVIYNIKKEYTLAIINFLQLIVNVWGNYILMDKYGVIGIAMSTTIVNVIGTIGVLLIVIFNIYIMED